MFASFFQEKIKKPKTYRTVTPKKMSLPRRILKETQRLSQDPVEGITAEPFNDNVRHFNITLNGPVDSAYEGGVFKLELFLPEDYPMSQWT